MFCYFGMLPAVMHDSALRDITGKAVNPKLNGMSAKGRSSSITPLLYIHCWQLTLICMRGGLSVNILQELRGSNMFFFEGLEMFFGPV